MGNNNVEKDTLVNLEYGERIVVSLPRFQGGMIDKNFTFGSVAGYAEESGWDVEERVSRAKKLNQSLYFLTPDGVMITAYQETPVKRTRLELGQIITHDDKRFLLESAANSNISLIEIIE